MSLCTTKRCILIFCKNIPYPTFPTKEISFFFFMSQKRPSRPSGVCLLKASSRSTCRAQGTRGSGSSEKKLLRAPATVLMEKSFSIRSNPWSAMWREEKKTGELICNRRKQTHQLLSERNNELHVTFLCQPSVYVLLRQPHNYMSNSWFKQA